MKIAIAALALMGAAGQDVGTTQDDPALRSSGWEVRVFVLERGTLKSVDMSDWTAVMDLEPRGGKEQKVTLQRAGGEKDLPRRDEDRGKAEPRRDEDRGKAEPRRDEDRGKAEPRRDDDRAKVEPRMGMKPMVCGQVKDMDPYYVELVVVPMSGMEKGLKEPGKDTGNDAGKVHEVLQADGEGYRHGHGGSYFKANLPRSWWTDAKGGALAFDADIHFTYGKDKKSVKGFSYPFGLYKDSLEKVMDEDLKHAREFGKAKDATKWKEVGERIKAKMHALPELVFKKDQDRQEFEKAKSECMAACERLRNATTAEEASKAADDCADKCDDYQDQSQDAEGAQWEWKGWEHHKRKDTPPSDTPRK